MTYLSSRRMSPAQIIAFADPISSDRWMMIHFLKSTFFTSISLVNVNVESLTSYLRSRKSTYKEKCHKTLKVNVTERISTHVFKDLPAPVMNRNSKRNFFICLRKGNMMVISPILWKKAMILVTIGI